MWVYRLIELLLIDLERDERVRFWRELQWQQRREEKLDRCESNETIFALMDPHGPE